MRRLALALALLAAAPAAAHAQAAPLDEGLLALRFRPALYFAPKEPWRPLEVERFLAERSPSGARHRRCIARRFKADRCHVADEPRDLRAPWSHLDLRGARANGADAASPHLAECGNPRAAVALRDCERGPWTAIYYNVTVTSRRIYVDYWWLLRFNEYTPDHEGDWEGVTVALTRDAIPQVDHVAFSAHGRSYRYPAGVATFEGEHVRVYVARGSHASYPRPCERRCRQTSGHRPEREFPGGVPWPANSDAECLAGCVLPLPEHDPDPAVHRRENAASWNGWSGRWGVPARPHAGMSSGPRSPGWQERYRAPWRAKAVKRTAF